VRALTGVSFAVEAGEAHANRRRERRRQVDAAEDTSPGLRGRIASEVPARCATLTHASPRDALAGGIGMVFQERLAFPNLTVAANIFAGREITRAGGRLDEPAMRARTRDPARRFTARLAGPAAMEHVSAANRASSSRSRARSRSTAASSSSTSRRRR
jgi:hypothetical protein